MSVQVPSLIASVGFLGELYDFPQSILISVYATDGAVLYFNSQHPNEHIL